MKKTLALCLWACFFGFSSLVFAYGEGPSNSGRWAEGKVTFSDGSKCGKCRVRLETNNGMSKVGFTDGSGHYKIYVASRYVKAVFVGGREAWSGSRDASGGTRIDVRTR